MSHPSRRFFCATLCHAVACAAAANERQNAALPIVRGQVEGDRVTVRIATTALAEAGGRVRVASNAGAFLVSRVGEREFVALTGTCSHESCQITDADAEAFVCPCHESKFSERGSVLRGPAERPLQEHATTFAEGLLTITVA